MVCISCLTCIWQESDMKLTWIYDESTLSLRWVYDEQKAAWKWHESVMILRWIWHMIAVKSFLNRLSICSLILDFVIGGLRFSADRWWKAKGAETDMNLPWNLHETCMKVTYVKHWHLLSPKTETANFWTAFLEFLALMQVTKSGAGTLRET